MVDTTDEWILQRTGIRERHIVDPGRRDVGPRQGSGARRRSRSAGLTPDDIGVIVVGTVTPDMMFPSTACLIQHKIGAHHAWGFDLSAACSAFTYSLTTASQIVGERRARARAGGRRRRDVEHHRLQGSRDLRAVRRRRRRGGRVGGATPGDGAILDFEHEIDGSGGPALCMPAGGSLRPPSHETVDQRLHYVKQDGADGVQVRGAQDRGDRAAPARAQRPRRRPISTCSCRTRPTAASSSRRPRSSASTPDKVIINIERFGNTTAATIPLALNDAVCVGPAEEGRPRAARLGRRRLHGRRGAAALGLLSWRSPIG